jgi:hypothetical protein
MLYLIFQTFQAKSAVPKTTNKTKIIDDIEWAIEE